VVVMPKLLPGWGLEALRPPTGRRPSNAHTHRAVSQQFLRTPSRHSLLLCEPVVGDG
jgi:hypothetical protein